MTDPALVDHVARGLERWERLACSTLAALRPEHDVERVARSHDRAWPTQARLWSGWRLRLLLDTCTLTEVWVLAQDPGNLTPAVVERWWRGILVGFAWTEFEEGQVPVLGKAEPGCPDPEAKPLPLPFVFHSGSVTCTLAAPAVLLELLGRCPLRHGWSDRAALAHLQPLPATTAGQGYGALKVFPNQPLPDFTAEAHRQALHRAWATMDVLDRRADLADVILIQAGALIHDPDDGTNRDAQRGFLAPLLERVHALLPAGDDRHQTANDLAQGIPSPPSPHLTRAQRAEHHRVQDAHQRQDEDHADWWLNLRQLWAAQSAGAGLNPQGFLTAPLRVQPDVLGDLSDAEVAALGVMGAVITCDDRPVGLVAAILTSQDEVYRRADPRQGRLTQARFLRRVLGRAVARVHALAPGRLGMTVPQPLGIHAVRALVAQAGSWAPWRAFPPFNYQVRNGDQTVPVVAPVMLLVDAPVVATWYAADVANETAASFRLTEARRRPPAPWISPWASDAPVPPPVAVPPLSSSPSVAPEPTASTSLPPQANVPPTGRVHSPSRGWWWLGAGLALLATIGVTLALAPQFVDVQPALTLGTTIVGVVAMLALNLPGPSVAWKQRHPGLADLGMGTLVVGFLHLLAALLLALGLVLFPLRYRLLLVNPGVTPAQIQIGLDVVTLAPGEIRDLPLRRWSGNRHPLQVSLPYDSRRVARLESGFALIHVGDSGAVDIPLSLWTPQQAAASRDWSKRVFVATFKGVPLPPEPNTPSESHGPLGPGVYKLGGLDLRWVSGPGPVPIGAVRITLRPEVVGQTEGSWWEAGN